MTAKKLCWGKRVSPAFRVEVIRIASDLGCNPDYLMACMAFETGRTFMPDIRNAAGSGACGLIQFMPSTAQALGTSTDALAKMSAVKQLEWVCQYFWSKRGKLKTLSDMYMAILWPAAVGKSDDYILFDKRDSKNPKRYIQNAGLDWNKDGQITKGEATKKVWKVFEEGMREENVA